MSILNEQLDKFIKIFPQNVKFCGIVQVVSYFIFISKGTYLE